MSIQPGRYIITNVKHANLAFLSNDNDGESLRSHYRQHISGEEWQVYGHEYARYSIQNYGHKTWARAVSRPAEKEHVTAERVPDHGRPPLVWFIKKSLNGENYTISTPKPEMIWWLDDEDQGSPITLHSPQLHDARGQWTFTRVYLEDEKEFLLSRGDSVREREQAEVSIKAAQEKAEHDIKAAEDRAQEAIRAAEERAQHAETLARAEAAEKRLVEIQAEIAINAAEERARTAVKVAEERAEEAIRSAEERVNEVYRRMARGERARREATQSTSRSNGGTQRHEKPFFDV